MTPNGHQGGGLASTRPQLNSFKVNAANNLTWLYQWCQFGCNISIKMLPTYVKYPRIPRARTRINKPCRRCVRHFTDLLARQPVGEEIGEQEKGAGLACAGIITISQNLEYRVKWLELQPVTFIEHSQHSTHTGSTA